MASTERDSATKHLTYRQNIQSSKMLNHSVGTMLEKEETSARVKQGVHQTVAEYTI